MPACLLELIDGDDERVLLGGALGLTGRLVEFAERDRVLGQRLALYHLFVDPDRLVELAERDRHVRATGERGRAAR